LLEIWRKVLKLDALSTTDDFFALGGHSILVTQVINAINGHYQTNVPVRLLFEHPTVKALARALADHEEATWQDDSRLAAALTAHSPLWLLQTLDRLNERQIDEALDRCLEDPEVAPFDDLRSLLEWARSAQAPAAPEQRPAAPAPDASRQVEPARPHGVAPSPGAESLRALYAKHLAELMQATAVMQSIHVQRRGGRSMAPSAETIAASIGNPLEAAVRIFGQYALELRELWSAPAILTLTPADLRGACVQMMTMASAAASLATS
jgi:hypothetical protein